MSVAYRMLGSVTDAEDAVQDAYLQLQMAGDVASPEGFLIKATTCRCIDQLRKVQRRQSYIGPWIPEPIDTKEGQPMTILSESLTQAFLLILERLTPTERAAFLLRTVFDYEYAEIAQIIGKSEVHVRQIVSRTRARLDQDWPRFQPDPRDADELAERFIAACRNGDAKAIESMFMEGAEVHSDGGGKATAARVVIRGREKAARFMAGVFGRIRRNSELTLTKVNGTPGFSLSEDGTVSLVVSLHVERGVKAVYITINPEKLSRWSIANIL